MRNILITACLPLLLALPVQAQYYFEIGGGVGAANYLGEIGGVDEAKPFVNDIQLTMTRPGFTAFGRYFFYDWLAVNAGISHGWIQGADSLSENPNRFSRNLSFRNQIIELYARGELHFFRVNDVGRTGRYRLDFSAYAYGGGAGFFHNPQAHYKGEWIALQPLETEGVSYSLVNWSIPAGVGLFFTLDRHHRFGWEFGWRYTMTDYLDDVSTFYKDPGEFSDPVAQDLADRSDEVNPNDPKFIGTEYFGEGTASQPSNPSIRGNPDADDSYMMTYFTYSFVFRGKSNFSRSKYNFVTGKVKRRKSRAKF